jgi:hypothetical protein
MIVREKKKLFRSFKEQAVTLVFFSVRNEYKRKRKKVMYKKKKKPFEGCTFHKVRPREYGIAALSRRGAT